MTLLLLLLLLIWLLPTIIFVIAACGALFVRTMGHVAAGLLRPATDTTAPSGKI